MKDEVSLKVFLAALAIIDYDGGDMKWNVGSLGNGVMLDLTKLPKDEWRLDAIRFDAVKGEWISIHEEAKGSHLEIIERMQQLGNDLSWAFGFCADEGNI